MIRSWTVLWVFLLLTLDPRLARSDCELFGADVNADETLNVVDVQCTILGSLWMLGGSKGAFPPCLTRGWGAADLDCGGIVDVVDVQLVITAVIYQQWPIDLNEDQDGCLDACVPSCCQAHEGTGCARAACEQCVCAHDPICCSVAWDTLCAVEHTRGCGADCHCMPVGPNPCCGFHYGGGCSISSCSIDVKSKDNICKARYWDEVCMLYGQTAAGEVCGCDPPEGDCCTPNYGPGCGQTPCMDCVCKEHPYCCTFIWDVRCSIAAAEGCQSVCGCAPIPKGECCEAHMGTGCSQADCEECVCATDPTCCSAKWDGICAGGRASECQTACGCMGFGGQESCKEYHESPGCNDEKCAQCVCTQDPWCCRKRWDKACVARAVGPCGQVCGP